MNAGNRICLSQTNPEASTVGTLRSLKENMPGFVCFFTNNAELWNGARAN